MAVIKDKNAFKAGLFILGALVAAGAVVWLVTGGPFSGGASRTVAFALDEDIAGLTGGSEVRVGGKPVGSVGSIGFDDDYERVLVAISLPGDVPLRRGAVARVQSSLTGQVWLNFTELGTGEPLGEDDLIDGEAGTLSDVIRTVNAIAPDLEELARLARRETLPRANDLLGKADGAVENLTAASDDLAGLAETLNGVFGAESGGDEELRATLAGLRRAADRLPGVLDEVDRLAAGAAEAVEAVRLDVADAADRLASVLEKADVAAGDVVAAAEGTRETVASARGIITANRGEVEAIVDRLGTAARTLELATSEIRRSPWRLLYRPGGDQRANLDLYDAARRFAEGANAVQDAAVALEGATQDPAADRDDVDRLLAELRESVAGYERAERALFERIRE